MEAFVCTTILKGDSVLESADLLSVWIQVADKLRNTEKDLLGFNSVMTALEKNAVSWCRCTVCRYMNRNFF